MAERPINFNIKQSVSTSIFTIPKGTITIGGTISTYDTNGKLLVGDDSGWCNISLFRSNQIPIHVFKVRANGKYWDAKIDVPYNYDYFFYFHNGTGWAPVSLKGNLKVIY